MSYKVPLEIPKHCNKCPFGHCVYSKPFWSDRPDYSCVDGEINKPNTYGYVCQISKNSKVLRAEFDSDIKKPDWCELKEVSDEKKVR